MQSHAENIIPLVSSLGGWFCVEISVSSALATVMDKKEVACVHPVQRASNISDLIAVEAGMSSLYGSSELGQFSVGEAMQIEEPTIAVKY